MEGIAPALKLIWALRKNLDRGLSLRAGIQEFLIHEEGAWKEDLLFWFLRLQQGVETESVIQNQTSKSSQHLLRLLERGLKGEAISNQLGQLETEIHELMNAQIDEFVSKLPYLLMIPLALFLFPACLTLMLGPFLVQLTNAF